MTINMDYCKYENTVRAMQQIFETLHSTKTLSPSEQQARRDLYHLCAEYVEFLDGEED